MKILVLGGTRFFGIHMVNALIESGHDVISSDISQIYLLAAVRTVSP